MFTTVDKAVWAADSLSVYAAVPDSGIAGSGNLTKDSITHITIENLAQKSYPNITPPSDAEDLFLSKDGNTLFFRNAQDGYLYYLDVSK